MNLTRREFVKSCAKVGLLAAGSGISGCLERAIKEEVPTVKLEDIINNSGQYETKQIITEGYPERLSKGIYNIHTEPKKESMNLTSHFNYILPEYKKQRIKGIIKKENNTYLLDIIYTQDVPDKVLPTVPMGAVP